MAILSNPFDNILPSTCHRNHPTPSKVKLLAMHRPTHEPDREKVETLRDWILDDFIAFA